MHMLHLQTSHTCQTLLCKLLACARVSLETYQAQMPAIFTGLALVQNILKVLGLEICADTIVGDQLLRGISGGQKKRVTSGTWLPSCIDIRKLHFAASSY